LNSITPKDKKQREEIKKLENQIKILQEEEKNEKKEKKAMFITNRHFVKFRFFGMVMVFLGYIFFQSLDVLYLILTAYIVSIAMEAVVDMLERRKLTR
jgi:hypothetical protein